MSYVVPGVLIYQQLASNAGVSNVTPDLDAVIIGPAYNVLTYNGSSTSSLTQTATVDASGATKVLSNNAITNTFFLPSTKVGQVVESSSVQVYLNQARVQTKVLYMTGTSGDNTLSFVAYTGTGAVTSGSNSVTGVTNVAQLNVGDNLTLAGAGAAGAALTSTITAIVGSTVTIADNASTTVAASALTRTSFNNLNSTSATLRVEAGDAVVITSGSTIINTSVLSVTGTTGALTQIKVTDVLPAGIAAQVTVSVRKVYNNLLLPITFNSYTNYSLANVTTQGSFAINPLPVVSYGTVVTANVHVQYRALRADLTGLLDIANDIDRAGVLGEATDLNPLGLGVQLALANTVGRIRAIALASDDLAGYLAALDLIENQKVYCIVPLTQKIDILSAVQQHVEQLSTPESAAWRIALVNTAIPSVSYIGQYNPDLVNANGGNNAISNVSGSYVLTSSNSQFVSDGVAPGDTLRIASHSPAAQTIASLTILSVLNNQQVVVNSPLALSSVNFYVQRNLSRTQQASAVAAVSSSFTSSRVFHIQPDTVGVTINGVTKYLPGFYMCAALSGLVSGLPAQQSLTNVGVAGIADLSKSNFYFTRPQLATMAEAGTWLMVQEAAGTIPYSRHSLSTDMSVLQYREIQQVKNIDFLSYFFFDKLKAFPGRYNITPDTLQTLRTTLIAGAKLLQGKRLPKIGAPLLDYSITTLKQDEVNKDQVIIEMRVFMPTVMNYINLYLIY